jgi:ketosteroid isomerase-like protein
VKRLLVLLLVATTLFTRAAADEAATKALLAKQAADWDAAIWRKDQPAIEANLGEGFRHLDGNGGVSERAAFVADLMSPALTIDPYTVEDFDVRIYGEIALLSGTTRMTGTYEGRPFKSHYRYVDIYHWEHGRWVVVNIQITRFRE